MTKSIEWVNLISLHLAKTFFFHYTVWQWHLCIINKDNR